MYKYFSIILITLIPIFGAAADTPKVTGIYSNLAYNKEAGDALGAEIILVFGGQHEYFAIIQCAEGTPSKPVIVTATVKGLNVVLAANTDSNSSCPKSKYSGVISSEGLQGTFEGVNNYPGFLKRGKSYWQ